MPNPAEKSTKSHVYNLEDIPGEIWIPFRQLVVIRNSTIKSVLISLIESYVAEGKPDLEKAFKSLGEA